jgi:hypothetical protein
MVKFTLPFVSASVAGLFTCCFVATGAQPAASATWVPFTAQYAETSTTVDGAGQSTGDRAVITETRSKDGSQLSIKSEGGQAVSGELWDSCGQMFSLDYRQKRAVLSRTMPRVHAKMPSVPPTGTQTIAGISCLVYPIRGSVSGTICVDTTDDIALRTEWDMKSGGNQQHYLKELTSIDFATPVDASRVSIPAGFAKLVPENGSPLGCAGKK